MSTSLITTSKDYIRRIKPTSKNECANSGRNKLPGIIRVV